MSDGAKMSAEDVARRSISFDGLQPGAGELLWVESGTMPSSLVRWSPSGGVRFTDVRPESELHAYGGGAVAAGAGGGVWYVKADDGQVYQLGQQRAMTHDSRILGALGVAGATHLVAVGERGDGDDLLLLSTDTGQLKTLMSAPFVSTPRWRAGQLAWISWQDDAMPWDSSELWLGVVDEQMGAVSPQRIAGGKGISVVEPKWSPTGVLHYLSDESGWWNLYRWTADVGSEPVAPMKADCAAAPWEEGYSSYAFLTSGAIAMIAQRGSRHTLLVIDACGDAKVVETKYSMIKPYLAAFGDQVALIGASPQHSQELVLVTPGPTVETKVLRTSEPVATKADISVPRELTFSTYGVRISINYYPASGAAWVGTIVRAHSGPTYQSDLRLDNEVQFFTSNGFAIADVDYRGSTGRGRSFRTALDGNWGVLDVSDCATAAQHLIRIGLAEPGHLIIMGASAGGFTALKAVTDPQTPFAAAIARSPIVDPQRWTKTAPRFQRAHAAILSPAQDAAVDPHRVCRPIAVVHGSRDAITPAADATGLVRAVRSRSREARLLELDGAGHFLAGAALVEALTFEVAACRDFVSVDSSKLNQ